MVCGVIDPSTSQKNKEPSRIIVKLLPLIAFAVPLGLLYFLNSGSFELMWKGRTFQLFFVWLLALEFIFSWETIQSKINLQNKKRLVVFAITLLLPTFYVVLEYYLGLNSGVVNWSAQNGVTWADSMPLAIEYLVFSVLFSATALISFGKKGLMSFALPALFVALVGVLYTIDNVFPYGQFTPFQLLVPTTATLATGVLGLMGNTAVLGTDVATGMPLIHVTGPLGTTQFTIAWPCAGIESLLIFTAVTLLFVKRINISWKAKLSFFAFGAAITYFINVLRIATIFSIGMQYGAESSQVQAFHFYYGPLYAMGWIISYPFIVLASQSLWGRIKNQKTMKPLLSQLSPA